VVAAVAPGGAGYGDEQRRYPQDSEMAVYFCCLEALQNAAKYSEASKIEVHLVDGDEALRFSVEDDGRGFDPARWSGAPVCRT
jgi:signal transduction histidine kinase